MKLRTDGCVLCGSTWGDYWEEVDGERCFFCCEVCARQLTNLVAAVVAATGWDRLDSLAIEGDRRGRRATVTRHDRKAVYSFVFGDDATVRRLRPGRPAPDVGSAPVP
ncbi:MAG TPA: TA0938 family protein [Thermoplasmata archaeon]|nr:TA0938 family protein [Thermoplasmata archaeon]